MSTDNLTHHDVTHKAAIAHAAFLAAYYTNDERRGIMAQEEMDRLSKIDFPAKNAGENLVDSLIHEGIEVARRSYPDPSLCHQRIRNAWELKIEERLGCARSLPERDALFSDLWTALDGYAKDMHLSQQQQRRQPRRQGVLNRLAPTSLTVGVNAIFVRVRAQWRQRGDD